MPMLLGNSSGRRARRGSPRGESRKDRSYDFLRKRADQPRSVRAKKCFQSLPARRRSRRGENEIREEVENHRRPDLRGMQCLEIGMVRHVVPEGQCEHGMSNSCAIASVRAS